MENHKAPTVIIAQIMIQITTKTRINQGTKHYTLICRLDKQCGEKKQTRRKTL